MRLNLLALFLALAAALVVAGVATWSTGAAFITAGAALGALSWLFLAEAPGESA